MAATMVARDTGPATERVVARDLVRRGLLAAPVATAVGAALAGAGGAASVAFALGLVLANFWVSAALLSGSVLFPALTNRGDALVPLALGGLALALYTLLHPGARRLRVGSTPPQQFP